MTVSPADLGARARRMYERSARLWVVDPGVEVVMDVPLHPPTEREALADLDGARAWAHSWRRAEAELPVHVVWEERNWSRIGRQSLPVRVRVEGSDAVAAAAAKSREWRAWVRRVRTLQDAVLGAAHAGSDARARTDAALRTHSRAIAQLDAADARILQDMTVWLIQHPASGLRVRQVSVRGIHTKWLERHRSIVEALVTAVTGVDGLGLVAGPERLRISILDPALRPAGVRDLAAPLAELAALPFGERLEVVVIVENLETLLALPDAEGVVAIHGSGYIGHLVAQLAWVMSRPVLYWGDLDSHGFAILNRVRAAGVEAQSVLMNRSTLEEFRDLWVDEPTPFRGELSRLTDDERSTFVLLREYGDVRLEQERIAWPYAWEVLWKAIEAVR
ncbi:Wadjet anti-phage system protein JetD domain-containing protein [Microbacterium sp.]|uniref:Wadjet anti-phage system protein JetD domain-containing protein n=1 Tax=Microbacterium sp. TaxID=51671 RepID=UPI002623E491|nr:DUF3322 and DUF2220 domain-containing protein [uncultured Microbacterium sp.]